MESVSLVFYCPERDKRKDHGRIARAASRGAFIEAENDLWIDSHIRAGRRDIERIREQIGRDIDAWRARKSAQPPSQVSTLYVSFDGTQVPIRKKEIQGRKRVPGVPCPLIPSQIIPWLPHRGTPNRNS